jgi:cytochrome b561
MLLVNSRIRYGSVAIALHWGMAAVLLALLASGWYMVQLPDAGFDTRKISIILSHKSLGMVALMLAALRAAWRTATLLPGLAPEVPEWQQVMARFVHLCFYGLMFALPLTGWLMSSAGGFPVYLWFDSLPLPDLVRVDPSRFRFYIDMHRWLAYALFVFLLAHSAAALVHHFLYRDDTLRKMLP